MNSNFRIAPRHIATTALFGIVMSIGPPVFAQAPTPEETEVMVTRGEALTKQDPLAAAFRDAQRDGHWRRGFSLGMATAEGQTAVGPGKDRIHDSLPVSEQLGYATAVQFSLERNANTPLAAMGAAIANGDAAIAGARNAGALGFYTLGFDIATGIFGDATKGGRGNTIQGPGSKKIHDALERDGQRGFEASYLLNTSKGWQQETDPTVSRGEALANQDPLAAAFRDAQPNNPSHRGFVIGMAVAEGQTLPGPGKERIRSTLSSQETGGFDTAVTFSLERNANRSQATTGAAIANGDAAVAAARNAGALGFYTLGFDIATGIFGPAAKGGQGNTIQGPGSKRIHDALERDGQRGFEASYLLNTHRNWQ